ncbi:hypothetical protein B5E92_10520 [Erysipelatoclostridium sp. An15]|uniref:hypothetical protein n=1 Tax=Erysipelatoclostridium sp. An15 TaxID=1965566 RepID=UPI000B39AF4C|nr:hypothetical protein [Erysipelatoclostridium sp. An15]OUQ06896.1 hypothetical protein B5E92_10520 [Erysipelatoclostridium sp. An15]
MNNLLVTTKNTASKSKNIMIIISIVCLAFIIFFLVSLDVLQDMGEELFNSRFIGFFIALLLIVFFLCIMIYGIVIIFFGSKSYLDVYEDHIAGKTALSKRNPNEPMQDFYLNYNQILNVYEMQNRIIIDTATRSYEVLATINRQEAIVQIKNHIKIASR